ncbi:MAG: nucleotide sugar dehydrogenase [Bacteroidales bacterium]
MNISIFGLGYVGCVSLGCLAKSGHNIIGVDISKTKIDQVNSGKATIIENGIDEIMDEVHKAGRIRATMDTDDAIQNSDLSIIAVGTPSTENGHLDLSYIFNVTERIGESLKEKEKFHIIAVRSTIMPGTCDKMADILEKVSGKKRNTDFAIVDNPEFLREGSAVKDYNNPAISLIGSDNKEAAEMVAELYRELPGEIVISDLRVAEIMKYVNNSFHALKISFANEIGNICSEIGIDSHKVMDIFTKDTQLNISPYYFKPGFAYGGSCLPKDLKGLQTMSHDLYIDTPLLNSIHRTNDIQIERAVKLIYKYWNKKLGFMGISFKAGTDDLRNSPAVSVIETLLGKACDISIYDRNINLSILTGTNKEYIDSKIPHLSSLLIDDPAELVQKCDVIIVTTGEPEFIEILDSVEDKIIIDFVRLDDRFIGRNNYIGINW